MHARLPSCKIVPGGYLILPCMQLTVTDLSSLTIIIDTLSIFPMSTEGIFPQGRNGVKYTVNRKHLVSRDQTLFSVLLLHHHKENGNKRSSHETNKRQS